jgi:hypothetical protein
MIQVCINLPRFKNLKSAIPTTIGDDYAIYVNKNTVLTIDNSNNMIAKNKHY